MNTIKVKKSNFDLDGICEKIKQVIEEAELGIEGDIHPAIVSCIDNECLYSTYMYNEMSYEEVKEAFYKGETGIALIYALESIDETIICIDENEYISNENLGDFSIDMESCGVIYLDCNEEDIYISTAYFGGGGCMSPSSVIIEENWGELDENIIKFIELFIKGNYEVGSLPEFDDIVISTKNFYVFEESKLIVTEPKESKKSVSERNFDLDKEIENVRNEKQCYSERKNLSSQFGNLAILLEGVIKNQYEEIEEFCEKLGEEPDVIESCITNIEMNKSKVKREDLLKEVQRKYDPIRVYEIKGYLIIDKILKKR